MKGKIHVGNKPRLSSSSRAFERRGNPWVTEKEGVHDFGRNKEIENPDFDADSQRARLRESRERDRRFGRPDFKGTLSVAVENAQLDSYFAEKKPEVDLREKYSKVKGDHRNKIDWGGARKGIDFEVEDRGARRRRLLAKAHQFNHEAHVPSSQIARVDDTARVSCGYGCGFTHPDSRMVSKHHQKFRNACCRHKLGCNCPDCRRARGDLV
jgi:hypothetical protein